MDQFTLLVGQSWPLIVFVAAVCSYIAYRLGLMRGRLGK